MIDLLAKPRHVRWSSWVTSASTAARDLFSLGVTFQQLLSGRLPLRWERTAGRYSLIRRDTRGLVRFLGCALAKNPDERYQTGEHFGGELRLAVGTAAKVDLEI